MRQQRKQKQKTFIESLKVTEAGAEGKAIARHENMVVFVEYAVPGDTVFAEVLKNKKTYLEARAVRILEPSPDRTEPFCQHFGVCGGCKWQHLSYDMQAKYKQKQVEDQLIRLGKLDIPEVHPIITSPETKYYRNKLEFTFSNKKWLDRKEFEIQKEINFSGDMNALGFHIPGSFDKIVDIMHCHLMKEPSNMIRLAIKKYAEDHKLTFFDLRNQTGFLRNLIIRTSLTGELMVVLSVFKNDEGKIRGIMEFLKESFPEITSLQYVVNSKKNDTISDQDIITYHGKDHILEKMDGLFFRVGPKSFYQTNSIQAERLYKETLECAGLTGNEVVYDLYTGTGTIASFLSRKAKKVVGLEFVPEAIEDAKKNAELNQIENCSFHAGDIKDLLNEDFFKTHGYPDVIVTDPPRAGMHEDVVKQIIHANPARIVYVSCNPATQARDLSLMNEQYKPVKVQPVDMFPHTFHVENIVLLERRNS